MVNQYINIKTNRVTKIDRVKGQRSLPWLFRLNIRQTEDLGCIIPFVSGDRLSSRRIRIAHNLTNNRQMIPLRSTNRTTSQNEINARIMLSTTHKDVVAPSKGIFEDGLRTVTSQLEKGKLKSRKTGRSTKGRDTHWRITSLSSPGA